MPHYDWERLLRNLSKKIILVMAEEGIDVPGDIIESQWLGLPGASEEQILEAESRLKVSFPPSYRQLLKLTNGWLTFSGYDDPWQNPPSLTRLHSTDEIDWYELPDYGKSEGRIPFINGLQDEKIDNAIEFTADLDGECWLLVPEIVSPNQEWAAWNLSHKGLCVDKYKSLYEAVEIGFGNLIDYQLEDCGLK